jgi:flagellum-specific peptidoglycan hydrolase FlgJ
MHRHIRGALCLGATAIAGIAAGLAYTPIQAIATGGQETVAVAGADQDGTQAETTEVGEASEPAAQQPAEQETAPSTPRQEAPKQETPASTPKQETPASTPTQDTASKDDTKADDTTTGDSKSDDTKTDDSKSDDTKTDDSKTDDSKSDDSKTDDSKSDDSKTDDSKSDGTKTDDSKSDDSKTDETKSDDTKSDDTDDSKSDDTKAGGTKADTKPDGSKAVDTKATGGPRATASGTGATSMRGASPKAPSNPVWTRRDTAGTGSSASVAIPHYTENLGTERFIALIGEQARKVAADHDVYASVMIAQAILESGSGSSALSQAPYNNLFGIKGSYQGRSVTMPTSEDDGTGSLYGIDASFRAYGSPYESMVDYADLVGESPVYKAARRDTAATPEDAARALQGTYATDTSYAAKLAGLIETYHLTDYDKPLDYEATDRDVDYQSLVAAVLANATSTLNQPYVWGGESFEEGGFDCSGLVFFAYTNGADGTVSEEQPDGSVRHVVAATDGTDAERSLADAMDDVRGLRLGRRADEQAADARQDVPVDVDHLLPGDTLYWRDGTGYVYHTAIYLGRGYYLEESSTARPCHVTSLEEKAPSFARRLVPVHRVETGR